jgi:hypothetical protein
VVTRGCNTRVSSRVPRCVSVAPRKVSFRQDVTPERALEDDSEEQFDLFFSKNSSIISSTLTGSSTEVAEAYRP